MSRETKAELYKRIQELEQDIGRYENLVANYEEDLSLRVKELEKFALAIQGDRTNFIGSIAIARKVLTGKISPYSLCTILLRVAQEAPRLLMEAAEGVVDPLEVNPGANREVVNFLRKGQKIQAIKVYREATGSSLRQAKDAVEKLQEEMENNSSTLVHNELTLDP